MENTDYYAENVTISNPKIEDLILEGVSLKNMDFSIIIKQNRGNVRNVIEHVYGFPVVSQTIENVLFEHCTNEIELFEVEVERKIN